MVRLDSVILLLSGMMNSLKRFNIYKDQHQEK